MITQWWSWAKLQDPYFSRLLFAPHGRPRVSDTPILCHQRAHLPALVTKTSPLDPRVTCLTTLKLSGPSSIIPFISYFAVKLPARKNTLPAENFYIWNMFAGAKLYLQGHAFDHKDGACQNLCLISEALWPPGFLQCSGEVKSG